MSALTIVWMKRRKELLAATVCWEIKFSGMLALPHLLVYIMILINHWDYVLIFPPDLIGKKCG